MWPSSNSPHFVVCFDGICMELTVFSFFIFQVTTAVHLLPSWLAFIRRMLPKGTHGSVLKSKKKKSEGAMIPAQFHLLSTMVSGVVCTSSLWYQMFFQAPYVSGTYLSHLTEGGYGFNVLGSPGIDMYQIYIVAPMVKAGMTYIGVCLIYKPHGLFAGGIKRCAIFLRTFFDRCESEVNVALNQAYFL